MRRIGIVLHAKTGDLSRWLFSGDNRIILAALLFTLLIRLFTIQMIDDAGDSKMYMDHVRQLVIDPSGYSFDHWSARFALIAPVYLVRIATGGLAAGAYVLPVFLTLVMVFFSMKTSGLFGRIEAGFIAAIIMGVYPARVREGSQILPGIFSMAYLMASFYFLMLYLRREETGLLSVFLSALMMFLAYGTHIINIFFAPGMALILFIGNKRRWASMAVFSLTLFLFFMAETALYHFFTPYSLGHLDIIRFLPSCRQRKPQGHGQFGALYETCSARPFWCFCWPRLSGTAVICVRRKDHARLYPFVRGPSFLFLMVFVPSRASTPWFRPFRSTAVILIPPCPFLFSSAPSFCSPGLKPVSA
jgi:4-amino-4-deoxy-L-arabinose transferase-like glycosyltransferase